MELTNYLDIFLVVMIVLAVISFIGSIANFKTQENEEEKHRLQHEDLEKRISSIETKLKK